MQWCTVAFINGCMQAQIPQVFGAQCLSVCLPCNRYLWMVFARLQQLIGASMYEK